MGARALRFYWKYSASLVFLLCCCPLKAELPKNIQFKADYYNRDLVAKVLRGRGNAYIRNGSQELWADEVEVDLQTNLAVATGNVRTIQGELTLWSSKAHFNLKGQDAEFEDATLVSGQLVIAGRTIRRFTAMDYEVLDGTYSNCNLDMLSTPSIAGCSLDWKISGRRFRITMGEYAHFYDVIVQAKNLPLVYSPYLILPIKTQRQTGFLMPSFSVRNTIGTGFTLPLFLALSPWQDLTINSTHFSTAGLHFGLLYRYIYSNEKLGRANVFLTTRRFGPHGSQAVDPGTGARFLGVFGEGAVSAHNIFQFSGSRAQSRQMINWVSDPYYAFDYTGDLEPRSALGSLRSQLSYTRPGNEWLFTAQAQYLQSLIVSKDNNVDGGTAAQLPILAISKMTTPLLGQRLSYEFDALFTHYSRGRRFDQVPSAPVLSGANTDTDSAFDSNDYIRTGNRLQLEPRLVVNVPMPAGFQLQPIVRAGALAYHFAEPSPTLLHREYLDLEIPLGMQISRVFTTSIEGFEKVSHTFQPRAIYASSIYQSGEGSHPFFYRNLAVPNPSGDLTQPTVSISSPRFDLIDQLTPYEYMRFELINRFRRRSADSVDRFFWFQLSEQYNIRTSNIDPRFYNRLGPIELFSSFTVGRFSLQLQSSIGLEDTKTLNNKVLDVPVRETSLSAGIVYQGNNYDMIAVNALYRKSADPAFLAQMATLSISKSLPTFFNIDGMIEYNFKEHQFYGYRVGLSFRTKPRSCWNFSIAVGRDSNRIPYSRLAFMLDFGAIRGI